MSNGLPSMTALLGLLAVAGYQHRDKIAEWLGGAGQQAAPAPAGAPQAGQGGALSGVLEQLRGSLSGSTPGGILSGGLGELIDRFRQNGQGQAANSWVQTGPNQPIAPTQVQQAIGPDVLQALSRQTGLSEQELLARLSRELPNAVDRYTPQGRVPTEAEFSRDMPAGGSWRG